MHQDSSKILEKFTQQASSPDADQLSQFPDMPGVQEFSSLTQGGFMFANMDPDHKACFQDLPQSLVQQKIFMLGNSRELFRLRQVCTEWSDLIKMIWCQVVKDEMLEQVQNLDLLYEKETTSKLLEFKLKYLVSYAQLMRNYFQNMVFSDIVQELRRQDCLEDNLELNNLGQKMLVITCLIVCPQTIGSIGSSN
jgi:hypothetical protein